MTTVSGLSAEHASHARGLLLLSAKTMVANKTLIHYSQGADRMEYVRNRLTIIEHQYPKHGDCSSTTYGMLWDAIHRNYGVRDLVAGCNWNPDGLIYTGSMYKNGKRVVHDENIKVGDLIYFGDQGGGIPEHVAMAMGGRTIFSHGSEGGPYFLDLDYRGDRRMTQRYI